MTTFSDLALDPRVLQAVSESGYETPTPIQVQAIPHALEGRDVLGIAQTGTGKTGAFVLPMLCALSKGRARARMPRSLVLAPTRELAAQVAEQFEKYSAHLKLTMALLIGGVSFKDQDKLIDRGVDVLIATPGRLLDHFERGKLMLTGVNIMVVDEADRMLDMGFIPDIERIFKLVPFTRQTLFFSATMAPEITRITDTFLHNPVRVEVARQATTSETIEQVIVKHTPRRKDTAAAEKREVLRRLIRSEGDSLTNGIVFCNRKVDVDVVAKSLTRHGFDASALHGDLDQKLRMSILSKFRDGDLKLLIASDVAARGLDIPNVSHVFNFDVPIHSEDYVHRIGRTGRAGRSGKSFTLCVPSDEKYLGNIEELVKMAITVIPSPLGADEPIAESRSTTERKRPARKGRDEPRERHDRTEERRPEAHAGEAGIAQAPAEEIHGAEPTTTRAAETRVSEARPVEPRVVEHVAAEAMTGGRRARSDRHAGSDARRSQGRGEAVTGMGDHVPAFLMRDFRFAGYDVSEDVPAGAADAAAQDSPTTPRAARVPKATSAPEPVVEAAAESVVAEPVSSELPAVASAATETDAGVLADAPVVADGNAEAAATEAPAPKPARRRRTSRAAAKPAEEATSSAA